MLHYMGKQFSITVRNQLFLLAGPAFSICFYLLHWSKRRGMLWFASIRERTQEMIFSVAGYILWNTKLHESQLELILLAFHNLKKHGCFPKHEGWEVKGIYKTGDFYSDCCCPWLPLNIFIIVVVVVNNSFLLCFNLC